MGRRMKRRLYTSSLVTSPARDCHCADHSLSQLMTPSQWVFSDQAPALDVYPRARPIEMTLPTGSPKWMPRIDPRNGAKRLTCSEGMRSIPSSRRMLAGRAESETEPLARKPAVMAQFPFAFARQAHRTTVSFCAPGSCLSGTPRRVFISPKVNAAGSKSTSPIFSTALLWLPRSSACSRDLCASWASFRSSWLRQPSRTMTHTNMRSAMKPPMARNGRGLV